MSGQVIILLLIEFLDEFVFGSSEAAWPLIRNDLGLDYARLGLLLSLPNVASSIIEPALGILGDVWRRRVLILGGGVVYAAALLLAASSHTFALLLLALVVLYPSAGAFVGLAQATLMDLDPTRREQGMARWTFVGSLGLVVGPLALNGVTRLGGSWRSMFLVTAVTTFALVGLAARPRRIPAGVRRPGQRFGAAFVQALRALRRVPVLRWLTMLHLADLMMDVLLGFLALYLVDVVGATAAQAGMGVALWTGAALLGDLLVIPLLERVDGWRYLRFSAVVVAVLFVAFLLLPGLGAKLVLLVLLGFAVAGWYPVPQAQLYGTMPDQSGAVMAVTNIFGLAAGFIPLGLGLIAKQFDLQAAMWLLLLGPLALLIGVPRKE